MTHVGASHLSATTFGPTRAEPVTSALVRARVLKRLDDTWPTLMDQKGYNANEPIAFVRGHRERWSTVRDTLWERAVHRVSDRPANQLTEDDVYGAVVDEIAHAATQLPSFYGNMAQHRLWARFPDESLTRYRQHQDPSLHYPGAGGVCLGLVQLWVEHHGHLPLQSAGSISPQAAARTRFYQSAHELIMKECGAKQRLFQRCRALNLNILHILDKTSLHNGKDNFCQKLVGRRMGSRGVRYSAVRRIETLNPKGTNEILKHEDALLAPEFIAAQNATKAGNYRAVLGQSFFFVVNTLGKSDLCGHAFGIEIIANKTAPWKLRFFDPNVGEFEFEEFNAVTTSNIARWLASPLPTWTTVPPKPKSVYDFKNFPEFFAAWSANLYDGKFYSMDVWGRTD